MIQPSFTGSPFVVLFDDDVGPRFLIFQLNFIAHQFDVLALGGIGRIRRDDEQPDLGTFLAANHFDHFVETHVANIDEFRRSLGHRRDAIANFQTAIRLAPGRPEPGSRFWRNHLRSAASLRYRRARDPC